ncbi:hypothetical protein ACFXGT_22160 [Streptomyces sp. NPDC059352]|uniref:hypothetical protein n=1 Tax=Streptomyces sp. NPDC059352 TaxID=3346810 RepID=UPI00368425C5
MPGRRAFGGAGDDRPPGLRTDAEEGGHLHAEAVVERGLDPAQPPTGGDVSPA